MNLFRASQLFLIVTQEAEAQIGQQANLLTRRSAGLPAMLAGILSPDDPLSFRHFVNSFTAKSQATALDRIDGLSLPQVHAMNTLREVMINSRFRSAIVPHVEDLLALATKNLGSEIWAIQNCGLMLYRACILRLPRETDTQELFPAVTESESLSAPVELAVDLLRSEMIEPSGRYPVMEFFSEEEYGNTFGGVEQKFAALDMIFHVRPTKASRRDASNHIIELLRSPVWLVRERAADVLAMLVPLEQLRSEFNKCLDTSKLDVNQNKLHGTLLLGRQLLNRRLANTSKVEISAMLNEVMQKMLLMIAQIGHRHLAPPIWAALLEIANTVSEHSLIADVTIVLPLLVHEDLWKRGDIRGYFSAEAALTYNLVLQLIKSDRNQPELRTDMIFSTVLPSMAGDPNVARFILERLLSQALAFRPQELLQLCEYISPETHSDAAPLISNMVTLSVEMSFPQWNATIAEQILGLLNSWSFSREVRASSLVARGRLVTLLMLKPDKIAELDTTISHHQHQFEQDVNYAARDEMDTYVRLEAAKALSGYLPAVPVCGVAIFGLLLTLRDLLNDDDEDIRSLAAHTSSNFLSRDSGGLQFDELADGTTAPAISIRLEGHLRSTVCGDALQPEDVLCRLLGVSADVSLDSYLLEYPVYRLLKMFRNESQALFAVERQNLYIDEVQEIAFWSSLWRTVAEENPRAPEKLRLAMASWVFDGLKVISTILRDIKETCPMLPNLTHDLDTLLLWLRVVRVAEVYATLCMDKAENPNSTCTRLRQQLQDLKILSSRCHINRELTCTIDGVFEKLTR